MRNHMGSLATAFTGACAGVRGERKDAVGDECEERLEEAVVSMVCAASGWLDGGGEVRCAMRSGDCMFAAPVYAAAAFVAAVSVAGVSSLCALLCCAARPLAWCSTERSWASCCLCAVMWRRSLSI